MIGDLFRRGDKDTDTEGQACEDTGSRGPSTRQGEASPADTLTSDFRLPIV